MNLSDLLIRHGLAVFPIPAGQKRAEPGWQGRCSTDVTAVLATWPDTNIGVGCRASGIVGLDLDQHSPEADGMDAFREICNRRARVMPRTFTVRTPNGWHMYFRAPAGRAIPSSIGRLAPGIDVRAPGKKLGGYLVGPGSIVDGRRYEIASNEPIVPLPDWLADLLISPAPPTPERPAPAHLVPEVTGRGLRHMPPLAGTYGGTVRLAESSAANGPHAWLRIDGPIGPEFPGDGEGVIHLTLDTLRQLRDQADFLITNHYQVRSEETPA